MDLRERLFGSGAESLSDVELLAVLLGTGAPGEPVPVLAASLLLRNGGLSGLLRASPVALAETRGLGPAKAARIVAALELGRRSMYQLSVRERPLMNSFQKICDWASSRLTALEHEEVWLLALDGKRRIKAVRRIAQGGMHGCGLTIKDVLTPALRDGASAMVIVHNHPSGDPTPSLEDLSMTHALASAAACVGIQLVDHVVIARHGACSVLDPTLRVNYLQTGANSRHSPPSALTPHLREADIGAPSDV